MEEPSPGQTSAILVALQFLLLALFLLPCVMASSPPRHIHLSWESDPRTSVTITWRTDSSEPSIVEYGLSESPGFVAVGPPGVLHHVQLANLTPSTFYNYRCGNGTTWSQSYNFTTGPDDEASAFSFGVIGDERGGYAVMRAIGQALLETGAEFVLDTGDLVSDGRNQQQWDRWFETGEDLLSQRVLMPTLGNHEEMAPNYFEQMALPGNEQWYSFDYGNAHFIALNTETNMLGNQLRWLEEDLAQCNSTWKFVFFHRPMYSSGYHGSDLSVRRAWEKTLNRYGVDIVFSGHDHIYERTKPMLEGHIANATEGTIHVITGGGGAGLHDLRITKGPWTVTRLSEHHYVLVTVREGALHCEARLPDGTVFDEFDVFKNVLPDLQIVSVTTDPVYPAPGQGAKILTMIKNGGQIAAGAPRIRITIAGNVHQDLQLDPIGPGEEAEVMVGWNPVSEGVVDVLVTADPTDEINEGLNEDNNDLSTQVFISDPKPDLILKDITCVPSPPLPNEEITLSMAIANVGNQPSTPSQVHIIAEMGSLNHTAQVQGLLPGDLRYVEVPWTTGPGDWRLIATVDYRGEIEEIREDNNARDEWFHVRDLVKVGGAHIPKRVPEEGSSVIYYNASQGPLGNSSEVIIIWGVDGWQRPPGELEGPSTIALSRVFETTMLQFNQDLWVSILPSSPAIQWIDLRFSDQHLFPGVIDDNDGKDWRILGRPWAEAQLTELIHTIQDAGDAGANISGYLNLVEVARGLLGSGDYPELSTLVQNATSELRRIESISILERASLEYDRAVKGGVQLDRVVGIYLDVARTELGMGNHERSKQMSIQVLRLVDEARAKITEHALLAVLLITLVSVGHVRIQGRNRFIRKL